MTDQHIATYREEAAELLAELETSLLDLEETPDNHELINRVFRAMHTIKGSGAMFGFDEIAAFTHEVETVFDQVRNGKLAVTKELLDLTLQSRDHISALLDASAGLGEVDRKQGDAIVAGLRKLLPQAGGVGKKEEAGRAPAPAAAGEKTWRIRFRPNRELLLSGSNPLSLLNELRDLGACRVIAQLEDIPTLDSLNSEHCYIYWDIILTTNRGEEAIRDVFIFVEDDCEIRIAEIDAGPEEDVAEYKKLGEILVERGDIEPDAARQVLGKQKRFGELLVEEGIVAAAKVASALVEQQQVRTVRQERAALDAAASIRVPAERLDQLVNLVGEMVTVQAHLTQVAASNNDPKFIAIAEEVERLTNELSDPDAAHRQHLQQVQATGPRSLPRARQGDRAGDLRRRDRA